MTWDPSAFMALLTWGLHVDGAAEFLLRIGVGLPFFVSGMDKCFCSICHGWLVSNLRKSQLPKPEWLCWWVGGWEAVAGLTLALGLFTGASAFILLVVCIVAWIVSWRRKLEAKKPAHAFDAFTELGFMFDTLLIWMLLAVMFTGPGPLSIDALLFAKLAP